MISRIEEARMLAYKAHQGQSYDFWPYEKHLRDVEEILTSAGYNTNIIIAGICHDLLEDSNIGYNDLKKVFGSYVADIVYAVTDELGHNRKERKAKVYDKLKLNRVAIIVKLADRLANTLHSKRMESNQFEMYMKEYSEFKKELFDPNEDIMTRPDNLWKQLDDIYSYYQKTRSYETINRRSD